MYYILSTSIMGTCNEVKIVKIALLVHLTRATGLMYCISRKLNSARLGEKQTVKNIPLSSTG